MRTIYGNASFTLTEVIEQLMILQGNVKQNHYPAYLLHAQHAWKRLLWKTIWSVKQKVVSVVDGKVEMPDDIMRLVSLCVVDCHGNKHPLGYNPNINTLKLTTVKGKCSCTTCNGVGTLCGAIDVIQMRTETISVAGQDRTKRIWYRKNERGDLQQVTEVPVYDAALEQVTIQTIREAVCALELTESGCIAATEPNRRKIMDCCGDYVFGICGELGCTYMSDYKEPSLVVTPYENAYGKWNWAAEESNTIWIKESNAKNLIVTYQTTGQCPGEEMLVPEFAQDALNKAIVAAQSFYNKAASKSDKEFDESAAEKARTRLLKFLNPIRLSTFVALQGKPVKW